MFADLDLSDHVVVTERVVRAGRDADETKASVAGCGRDVEHLGRETRHGRAGGRREVVLIADVGHRDGSVRLDFVHNARVERDVSHDVGGSGGRGPLVADATTTVGIGELDTHEGADEAITGGCSADGAFTRRRRNDLDRLELQDVGRIARRNRICRGAENAARRVRGAKSKRL